jgi:hypothetical protein
MVRNMKKAIEDFADAQKKANEELSSEGFISPETTAEL